MSSTALKLVALALMAVDHVGEFLPGMPVWLRWLGRLSAPLFFYCAAVSFRRTSNRRRYLLRLYLSGAAMAVLSLCLNNIFARRGGVATQYITNNIFPTILLFCVFASLFELLAAEPKRGRRLLALFLLYQLLGTLACAWIGEAFQDVVGLAPFFGALLANAVYCEGGPMWILLGVLLYFSQGRKSGLALAYGGFCAVLFGFTLLGAVSLAGGISIANGELWSVGQYLFYFRYQWMMTGALPLMLLHNGARGRGLKWLFYLFYPAHIAALFLIGNLCLA